MAAIMKVVTFEINMSTPDREIIHVIKEAKIKGSVAVFPSFVWRRVKPVTAGTRYSLVNWHQGRLRLLKRSSYEF